MKINFHNAQHDSKVGDFGPGDIIQHVHGKFLIIAQNKNVSVNIDTNSVPVIGLEKNDLFEVNGLHKTNQAYRLGRIEIEE